MINSILLTAIDPIAGILIILLFGGPIQLIFNLIWWGVLRLFKFHSKVSWGKLFLLLALGCATFTLIAALHNTVKSFEWIRQLQSIYSTNRENSKIQPLELIGYWGIISMVITILFKKKKDQ